MIIVQLNGGLGNQMFQYAVGRSLSVRFQEPLKLDTMAFESYTLRQYRLGNYGIHADIATPSEIEQVKYHNRTGVLRTFGCGFERLSPYFRRTIYKEPHFSYDPNILNARANVYLEGYWQSERYFENIKEIIRGEFVPLTKPEGQNKETLEAISSCDSVSLHIRRGDYVSNPVTNAYHGTCSEEYYRSAIRIIEKNVARPHFFLFSDDPEWVRTHMNPGHPITVIDFNGPEKDYEDLRLMSACRHHILANSSFSWWGAWLNPSPQKMVIAPKTWFRDPLINTEDLTPDSWMRI